MNQINDEHIGPYSDQVHKGHHIHTSPGSQQTHRLFLSREVLVKTYSLFFEDEAINLQHGF